MLRGVLADARVTDTRGLRPQALELVRPPQAVFALHTVPWLQGVDTRRPRDRHLLVPECIVPHGSGRIRRPGVRCVEGYLRDDDVEIVDGVPTTIGVRTAADLLRTEYRPHALAAADAMAHAQLIVVADVVDYLQRLKGFPGVIQGRGLAALIEPTTESKGESWQRLRLIDAGFPRPVPQIVITDRAGRTIARLDMGYREQLIGAEYDGALDHTLPTDRRSDAARRELVSALLAWRIAVARSDDIWGNDDRFESQVGEWLGLRPLPRMW